MSEELRKALVKLKDQTTHEGYVAYTIYFIATWLAKWGTFDTDNVDLEYNRIYELAAEFLLDYDTPQRAFADCLNDFMRMKEENSNEDS